MKPRFELRFDGGSRGLVIWTMLLFSLGSSRCATAQDITTKRPDPAGVAETNGWAGMSIDHRNHIRLAGSRQTLSLDEFVAALSQSSQNPDLVREAIAVLRKRLDQLNAELRGTQLAKQQIENHAIAVRRTIRTNEQYLRVPSGSDADRVQRVERPGCAAPAGFQGVRYSVAEEESSLGHGLVTMAPYATVAPQRYSNPNYDAKFAKRGLDRVEKRLDEYEGHIASILALKKQVASSVVALESADRGARTRASRQPRDCHPSITALESVGASCLSIARTGIHRDEFRGVCDGMDRRTEGR